MLQITCPYCGPRNEIEFSWGGESHIIRPALDCDDQAWADYLFFRRNLKGTTFERWCHSYGCGHWFNVARDTNTHAILTVYAITEPQPARTERAA